MSNTIPLSIYNTKNWTTSTTTQDKGVQGFQGRRGESPTITYEMKEDSNRVMETPPLSSHGQYFEIYDTGILASETYVMKVNGSPCVWTVKSHHHPYVCQVRCARVSLNVLLVSGSLSYDGKVETCVFYIRNIDTLSKGSLHIEGATSYSTQITKFV